MDGQMPLEISDTEDVKYIFMMENFRKELHNFF